MYFYDSYAQLVTCYIAEKLALLKTISNINKYLYLNSMN